MPKYAADTSVSSELSRLEIEKTVIRYGATDFAYAMAGGRAMVAFVMGGLQIRFTLSLPDRNARQFTHTESRGAARTPENAQKEWEQACRQRWRALLLVIKAKLEAVECGISCIEDEFMAHIVLPGGATCGDFMRPQIERAYELGAPPRMLPMLEEGKPE